MFAKKHNFDVRYFCRKCFLTANGYFKDNWFFMSPGLSLTKQNSLSVADRTAAFTDEGSVLGTSRLTKDDSPEKMRICIQLYLNTQSVNQGVGIGQR